MAVICVWSVLPKHIKTYTSVNFLNQIQCLSLLICAKLLHSLCSSRECAVQGAIKRFTSHPEFGIIRIKGHVWKYFYPSRVSSIPYDVLCENIFPPSWCDKPSSLLHFYLLCKVKTAQESKTKWNTTRKKKRHSTHSNLRKQLKWNPC